MRGGLVIIAIGTAACSKGGERPPQEGAPIRAGSCEAGNEHACRRDCDSGQDAPCDKLAGMLLGRQQHEEASQLYKRLCEGGRKFFCPSHAFGLATGDGIAPDRGHARRLFEETCQYDPKACSEFGNLYMAGTPRLPRDPEMGSFLLDLACRYRDAEACRELADYRNETR